MHRLILRLSFVSLLALACPTPSAADDVRPLTVDDLPTTARVEARNHLPVVRISSVTRQSDGIGYAYTLHFNNGCTAVCDRYGKWTLLSFPSYGVPAHFVPSYVQKHVKDHYPSARVWAVRWQGVECEVQLSNYKKLRFGRGGKFQKEF